MSNNLEDKNITVFTEGGWKVSGVVALDKPDRLAVSDDDGSIYIILKSKICMIKMNNMVKDENIKNGSYNLPEEVIKENSGYSATEENPLGYKNQYGSLLLSDMLEEPASNSDYDADLSVSWGSSSKNIEVTIDTE
jgi:hypothetical protein